VSDALLALRLFAHDPVGLGGVWLLGDTAAKEAWLEQLAALVPLRRLPVTIDDDRLVGGVDLGASLAAGRPVHHSGFLIEALDSVVVLHGAERAREMLTGRHSRRPRCGGGSDVRRVDRPRRVPSESRPDRCYGRHRNGGAGSSAPA
jgi:hypothetical protein